jgi:hypothetical protein
MDTYNFLNTQKNSKSFVGVSNGTRRSRSMKKIQKMKKSRDIVPLYARGTLNIIFCIGVFNIGYKQLAFCLR